MYEVYYVENLISLGKWSKRLRSPNVSVMLECQSNEALLVARVCSKGSFGSTSYHHIPYFAHLKPISRFRVTGSDFDPSLDIAFPSRLPGNHFGSSAHLESIAATMAQFRPKRLDLGCFTNIKIIRDHTKRKVFEEHEPERCVTSICSSEEQQI